MTAKFIDCPAFLAELYTPELREIVPELEIAIADPSEDETVAALAGTQFCVNDHTYMPEAVLAACPELKAIVFMGTGAASFIDVAAAERLGIRVRNIKGYGDRSVAEHAVALMFAAGRQVARMDREVRAGKWDTLEGIELAAKTLGVVGTGGIGREMCRLGDALGMTVLAWNRSGVADGLPAEAVELDRLLAASDVVSLHLAYNDETHGFMNQERFAQMRPGAILVNTARGGVIDEAALLAALESGRLGHAALDVFEPEPLSPGHPLTGFDNVTLTAHAAFMTREASVRLLQMALEILREEKAALGG